MTGAAKRSTDEQDAWILGTFGMDVAPWYAEPERPDQPLASAQGSAVGDSGGAPGRPPSGASGSAAPGAPANDLNGRFRQAIGLAAKKLPGAAGERLMELATPANIALMVAFAGLYVAAQLTPAGWVADGIAIIGLTATAIYVGKDLSSVVTDLIAFVRITRNPQGDLDEAAQHLANAVSTVGIDVVMAILLHKAGKAAKPYLKPPQGTVVMVTPDGTIVHVPPEAGPVRPPEPMHMEGGASKGGPEAPSPKAIEDALAKGDIKAAAAKLGKLGVDQQLEALSKASAGDLAKLHAAIVAESGAKSPMARMSDPAHRADLEHDPASKQPRPDERETALRVEQAEGVELQRFKPGPHQKGDWVTPDGKVFDGCSPGPKQFLDNQLGNGNYERSLRKHLEHSTVDKVVIDTTGLGYSETQLKALNLLIDRVAGKGNPKIIRIPK